MNMKVSEPYLTFIASHVSRDLEVSENILTSLKRISDVLVCIFHGVVGVEK